jgi:hypothetical protein
MSQVAAKKPNGLNVHFVKTLTVCSNKFTYLLESTSSQQLVVTFIMGLP